MGIFSKVFKAGTTVSEPFVFGVEEFFQLKGMDDIVVVGIVRGTIRTGDNVLIANPGDDLKQIFHSHVVGLEQARKVVTSVTNDAVGIRLSVPAAAHLRIGTVLFSESATADAVNGMYQATLGNSFVKLRDLGISDEELNAMSMSDIHEVWSYYSFYKKQQDLTEAQVEEGTQKIARLAEAFIKKLFAADSVYAVFNKRTGEPHLFSQTLRREDGYVTTPPDIRILPAASLPMYRSLFSEETFELREIKNGEDKKGIYNFLGTCFYVNGACGIGLVSGHQSISSEKLVPPPSYEGVPQASIPITNPDLMRWILLMGQVPEAPATEDEKTIFSLYYGFFLDNLLNAKLLVPMQTEAPMDTTEPDPEGSVTIKKDTTINLATLPGKHEKPAVRMYTDWNRMKSVFDNEWSGMVQPVSGMIDVFDIALNVTDHPAVGCYIDRNTYEEALKRAEKRKEQ